MDASSASKKHDLETDTVNSSTSKPGPEDNDNKGELTANPAGDTGVQGTPEQGPPKKKRKTTKAELQGARMQLSQYVELAATLAAKTPAEVATTYIVNAPSESGSEYSSDTSYENDVKESAKMDRQEQRLTAKQADELMGLYTSIEGTDDDIALCRSLFLRKDKYEKKVKRNQARADRMEGIMELFLEDKATKAPA